MKNTDWSLNLQQQSSEAGRYNTLEKFENAKVLGVYFCLAKDGESLGVDGEPSKGDEKADQAQFTRLEHIHCGDSGNATGDFHQSV